LGHVGVAGRGASEGGVGTVGHANIGIMLNTYSHVVAGTHEDAAEQVAALFRTPG
jgi:hypothetical protein